MASLRRAGQATVAARFAEHVPGGLLVVVDAPHRNTVVQRAELHAILLHEISDVLRHGQLPRPMRNRGGSGKIRGQEEPKKILGSLPAPPPA
jgi:hypothetical protein